LDVPVAVELGDDPGATPGLVPAPLPVEILAPEGEVWAKESTGQPRLIPKVNADFNALDGRGGNMDAVL
jgi:hypothetical protein